MLKYILALLFSVSAYGQNAALTTNGTYLPGVYHNRNYVKNPGAEQNANYITQSASITTRSTSSPLQGVASFLIDGTSSGQTVKFDTQSLETLLKGQNCEADFSFTGDATLYKAYVEQGSTKITADLQLTNEALTRTVSIAFACGDLSSNSHLVIETTSASAAAIKVDNVILSKNQNLFYINQTKVLGTLATTACASPFSTTSTTVSAFGTQTGCTYTATGLASAPATMIPAIKISSIPAGEVVVHVAGSMVCITQDKDCHYQLFDGTNYYREDQVVESSSGSSTSPVIRFTYNYPTSQANLTLELRGYVTSGGTNRLYMTSGQPGVITVTSVPSQSQGVLFSDNTNFDWVAFTPSTLQGFGTTTPATNQCQGKRQGPDFLMRCKFTSGTTVGSEARVGLITGLTSADTNKIPSIQLAGNYIRNTATIALVSTPVLIEPSVTYVTFGKQTAADAAFTKQDGNQVVANSELFSFYARVPIQGWAENQNAPLLIGSVTSGTSGSERIERAYVTNAGSCSISAGNQSGTWITSLAHPTTGECTLTLASGYFSGTPACTISPMSVDRSAVTAVSSSSVSTLTRSGGGTSTDSDFSIICVGAR